MRGAQTAGRQRSSRAPAWAMFLPLIVAIGLCAHAVTSPTGSLMSKPILRGRPGMAHNFHRRGEHAGSTAEAIRLRGGRQGIKEFEDAPYIIDLTGDRGVLKATTRAGTDGVGPAEKDEVYLLFNGSIECLDNRSTIYNGKNISGVQFDSTSVGSGAGLPRSFQIGAGNTLAAWDLAVRNMTKGERATILVHSDFGYGAVGRTTRGGVFIPPNATLRFELELLRWNEKDLHNDGGVVVSYSLTAEPNSPDSENHPEIGDEVLVRYTGRCGGEVFMTSGPGAVWVSLSDEQSHAHGPKLGEAALPPSTLPRGLLTVLTSEAVKGGRYGVTLSSDYAYGASGLRTADDGRVQVPPNASVEFDVELMDWNTVTDRYLDGTLMVKCFGQPADAFASACRDAAKATLSIEGRFAGNGSVFLTESNFTDLVVGNRLLPEAVETALALVRVGQRAVIFSSSSRMCDDIARFPFGEALSSNVTWSVTCHNVTRPSKMSVEERMEATRVRKEWGNELFRSGRVEEALDKYEVAYHVIRPQILTGNSEQQAISPSNTEAMQLRVDLCLNKAACYKRLQRYADDTRGIVRECSEALELRPTNVRALYRRAEAHMELGDLDRACIDIRQALEAEPDHAALLSLRARLRRQQKQADEHDQGLFKTMLRKRSPTAAADPDSGDGAAPTGGGAVGRAQQAGVVGAAGGAVVGSSGVDAASAFAVMAAAADAAAAADVSRGSRAGAARTPVDAWGESGIGVRGGGEHSDAEAATEEEKEAEMGGSDVGAEEEVGGGVQVCSASDEEARGGGGVALVRQSSAGAGEDERGASPSLREIPTGGDGVVRAAGVEPGLTRVKGLRDSFVGSGRGWLERVVGGVKRHAGTVWHAVGGGARSRREVLWQASACAAAAGASVGLAMLVGQALSSSPPAAAAGRAKAPGRGAGAAGAGSIASSLDAAESRDLDDMLQRGMGPVYGPDLPPVMGPPPPPTFGPEKPP